MIVLFLGIAFNMLNANDKGINQTNSYLGDAGNITGTIIIGGEQLKVTQNGEEVSKLTFGVDYFATDKNYTYDIRIKNDEAVGGAYSKYLRWKWTAIIDGVEENINSYMQATNISNQIHIQEDWCYLINNENTATKLAPQEDIQILETLNFNGEFDEINKTYGSVLDKYYSGSNIQIYLTIEGSTNTAWDIIE